MVQKDTHSAGDCQIHPVLRPSVRCANHPRRPTGLFHANRPAFSGGTEKYASRHSPRCVQWGWALVAQNLDIKRDIEARLVAELNRALDAPRLLPISKQMGAGKATLLRRVGRHFHTRLGDVGSPKAVISCGCSYPTGSAPRADVAMYIGALERRAILRETPRYS